MNFLKKIKYIKKGNREKRREERESFSLSLSSPSLTTSLSPPFSPHGNFFIARRKILISLILSLSRASKIFPSRGGNSSSLPFSLAHALSCSLLSSHLSLLSLLPYLFLSLPRSISLSLPDSLSPTTSRLSFSFLFSLSLLKTLSLSQIPSRVEKREERE